MANQPRILNVFPRSFSARMLAVAFVGIHAPLILLVVWLVFASHMPVDEMLGVLGVVLAATLLGTAATLWIQHRMLAPIRQAADALDDYERQRRLPELADAGQDEVSRLMRGINRSVKGLDSSLRELDRHVQTDALTGALSRRGSEHAMTRSVAAAMQGSAAFTLFVVDVDNLKQLNDGFGHEAGDRVLVRLVETARQWLHAGDWIGRWGGDEFLIGVCDTTDSACKRLEQWRDALEAEGVPGQAHAIHLSAGAAGWRPGLAVAELYRRADTAMYRAKFSGGRKLDCEAGAPAPT